MPCESGRAAFPEFWEVIIAIEETVKSSWMTWRPSKLVLMGA